MIIDHKPFDQSLYLNNIIYLDHIDYNSKFKRYNRIIKTYTFTFKISYN